MRVYRLIEPGRAREIVDAIQSQEWTRGKTQREYGDIKVVSELREDDPVAKPFLDEIVQSVNASPLMQRELLGAMFSPRFSRYGEGGKYDVHVDSAFMGPVRTDLAMTLFLTDDYEGGELCIDGLGLNGAPLKVKCSAGYAVVYECWRPHWVEPVTKGERVVAVTWLQSRVPGAEDREILQRLHDVIDDLDKGQMGAQERFAKLGAVHDKLVKRFSAN